MQRTRVIAGVAAALVAAGAGVALHDARDARRAATGYAATGSVARGAVAPGLASDTAKTTGGSVAAPATPSAVAPVGPRVVKTATLALSVKKKSAVSSVADRVAHVAAAHNGFVASTQTERGDNASSTITLRVPAASYDSALAELRTFGQVSRESLGGEDVTGQLVDLDARLRSLRVQEQSLNALMAKAATVGETLQVAQAVADVRTQIEQLSAQQAQLADQADFATITVQVLGPNASVGDPKPDPLLVKSLRRASAGTLDVFGGMIVVLGYAIPSAVLAAIGLGLWRLVNRRRDEGDGTAPAVS